MAIRPLLKLRLEPRVKALKILDAAPQHLVGHHAANVTLHILERPNLREVGQRHGGRGHDAPGGAGHVLQIVLTHRRHDYSPFPISSP